MMVSELTLKDPHDIYVCCGYNVNGRDGYILGWATLDEVLSFPVNEQLKFPARCIPISELHPIQYLETGLNELRNTKDHLHSI